MRTHHWLVCGALFLGAPLAARPSTAALERTRETPEEKLAAIEKRYNEAQNAVYEAYDAASTDEERNKALAGLPGAEYVPEFRTVAEEAAGTDTAVKAWMWVLRLEEDAPKAWAVVELLLSDHMDSLALLPLTNHLQNGVRKYGEEHVLEGLRAMVAESPEEKVRASALYRLGATLLASKSEANQTEGRDCLAAVVEEYGAMPYGGSTWGSWAEGLLFERDHLQIGMSAPNFEAVDENGVAWKLSDYRGKVVVVDFWGFW